MGTSTFPLMVILITISPLLVSFPSSIQCSIQLFINIRQKSIKNPNGVSPNCQMKLAVSECPHPLCHLPCCSHLHSSSKSVPILQWGRVYSTAVCQGTPSTSEYGSLFLGGCGYGKTTILSCAHTAKSAMVDHSMGLPCYPSPHPRPPPPDSQWPTLIHSLTATVYINTFGYGWYGY